jgi:hypothetical protein
MKTTNTINTTNNNAATYNFPPCSPEEFLDTINMERGDIDKNWEIVNAWTWEQRFAYYERCVNQPQEERKSPWEAVIERCVEKLCLGKVFEVFYNISDEMEPIAVVASKRRKDGTINPKDIHTFVHYTPGDIKARDIAMMNEYSRIVEETYGIHPRLLIVGKEFDNTVLRAIMVFGRDFSIFAKKKD